MELSTRAIDCVVHPTAAFWSSDQVAQAFDRTQQDDTISNSLSWEASLLNPKNRIDSLDFPSDPLWRIDGCAGLGTQYYAVPQFLPNVPPVRMDVFVPEQQPPHFRQQLDLDVAFHTKDGARLSQLAITRHIIRTLQLWTQSEFADLAAFEKFYKELPFGSRLVFENLSLDIRQIHVRVGPNHNLERQLLPLSELMSHWGSEFTAPDVVDFYDVHTVRVLHDSVCIARIDGDLYIFKALTSGSKYLYHELKTLCTLEPHPNILQRPVHVVRKTCKFGGKRAIAGFTTKFHSKGSLRDFLPQLRIHGRLRLADQLKWTIQLTSALIHLQTRSSIYYPDLRLDNIVLSDSDDAVMVDFEQRGVWCEFSAPEINTIEYVRTIATHDDTPEDQKAKYVAMLENLVPGFENLSGEKYTNPVNGYNVAWIALSRQEQEFAKVYMLGRVLWCIFEGVSGPQRAAVWQSYRWESDLEFPAYNRTPPKMRSLIDWCTRGRRETMGSIIIRQKSQLVLRSKPAESQTAVEVQETARKFWLNELSHVEEYLNAREQKKKGSAWDGNYFDRPHLSEVLTALEDYRRKTCQG